ncbi:hypothetical protein Tco_1002486 [Tanacetum coccineum]|uniref:Retroviral polymerase SH3-like domain-containing protein n=1 Tax=Tanacetum coccineum TaxID=301880 RepID=A0ABQ5F7V5_9ASTR
MPLKPDLSISGPEEFMNEPIVSEPTVKKPVFKTSETKASANKPKDKNVNAIRPKAVVNAARLKAVVNVVKGNNVNSVKASACWVWKPKTKVLDHVSKHNSALITLKKFDYVVAQGRSKSEQGVIDSGCSRHMTGNMSYLTIYEEIDGGYVAFGGNPKRGKITGRDHFSKFDGKANEGFFVGYSINSKAFRVFNSRTRIVKENLHVHQLLQEISLMDNAGDDEKKVNEDLRKDSESIDQEKDDNVNSTNNVNVASINEVNVVGGKTSIKLPNDPNMPDLEDIVYSDDDQDNGLQVKQKKDGIFISQDKYVTEILKKFGFTDVKTASTPMETQKLLLKYEDGKEVDVHIYRSMIGSLMYLTYSRPDIMFAVCACARYHVNPKVSHLHVVKRIFRYLKSQPKLGLWYPKDSLFDLVAYTDKDYAGASLDMKSTVGGYQFLRSRLISWQCKKHIVVANSTTKAEYMAASSCYGQRVFGLELKVNVARHNFLLLLKVNAARHNLLILLKVNAARHKLTTAALQALVDGNKIIVTEASVRRDLQLNDEEGTDCLRNATIFKELTRMGAQTTAWNEFSSTMASAIICLATNQKFNFLKYIFESMVKNLENVSGKGFSRREAPLFPTIMVQAQEEIGEGLANPTDPHHTLTIIQPLTSQPQKKQKPRKPKRKDIKVPQPSGPTDNVANEAVYEEIVIDLEKTKTSQAQEITSLKKRVKRLEKKGGSRIHRLKRLYKVSLSRREDSSDKEDMFGVHDLVGNEVVVKSKVIVKAASTIPVSAAITTTTVITDDEITLAKALAELRTAKLPTTTATTTITAVSTRPGAKGLVIHKEEQATTPAVSSQQPS